MLWMDTKLVAVLSNYHDPEEIGVVNRRVEGARTPVHVPKQLADYQDNYLDLTYPVEDAMKMPTVVPASCVPPEVV